MSPPFVLTCSLAPFFRFVLTRAPKLLGRSAQCDFVVNDRSISRKHAEIRASNEELQVIDLGSRNGTFVDNQRVTRGRVAAGQVLRFGYVPFIPFVVEPGASQPLSEEETDDPKWAALRNGSFAPAQGEMLSEAQRRVFALLLSGSSDKAIALELSLSHHTIHNHVRAILRTFGVHSRAELLAKLLHPSALEPASFRKPRQKC
jgi:DNA-binding CsgD family transcriptional regulator